MVAEWDYLMPDELLISIEKLVYGGDGLAHADGNTVFVPYVLPGEQVRATAKSKRKKLVWAKLLEVTSASAQREGATSTFPLRNNYG